MLDPFVKIGPSDNRESLWIRAPVRNKKTTDFPINPIKDCEEYALLAKWIKDGMFFAVLGHPGMNSARVERNFYF